jgi:drug/metabolite transporter (DMT)-like permease
LVPITIAVGEIPGAHPSVAFLFRAWSMPTLVDGLIMGGLGLVWAGWTYFMARAYSSAQAPVAAPFEYLSLPINMMWGFALWREIPTLLTVAGAALTLLSGIFILYLDRKARQGAAKPAVS